MTKFKGTGLVWDKDKNKPLCKFIKGEYKTEDTREINLLKKIDSIEVVSDESPVLKVNTEDIVIKKTKKQLVIEAKKIGIKGADRKTAEELIILLGE